MNTFLPYDSFYKSAECLDYKRLGKQRVEAWQIYNILQKGEHTICPLCKGVKCYDLNVPFTLASCRKCKGTGKVKTSWYNHPAVQMWKGYEQCLLMYGIVCCCVWKFRGYNDTLFNKFHNEICNSSKIITYPKWFGNKNFHRAMRSNLLRKDEKHYRQFGWTEPTDLPYIWGEKK